MRTSKYPLREDLYKVTQAEDWQDGSMGKMVKTEAPSSIPGDLTR